MQKFTVHYKKAVMISLALMIYFTVLTMVSFVRTTEPVAAGENLADYRDVAVLGGQDKAWVDDSGVHFRDSEGTEKVLSAALMLQDLQQIQVRFTAECPPGFEGTAVLHVDLYAEGYDAAEQEFVVELKAGQNEVSQIIDKGTNAPPQAQFRMFCLDPVQCDISSLSVQQMKEVTHSGIGICAMVAVVLVILLLMVDLTERMKNTNKQKREKVLDASPASQAHDQHEVFKQIKKAQWKDLSVLIPAASLSFTFCVFGPIEIYISNVTELWFPISGIFFPSLLIGGIACIVLSLVGLLLPEKIRKWYACFLVGLGFALYIQGNFIQTNYGVLDGREIQWDAYKSVAIWDTAIWILCLLAPFIAQKILKDRFKKISSTILCCMLLVQVVTLGTLALTTELSKSTSNIYLSKKNLYTVSTEKNVIVFVLDTFDQEYLEEILDVNPDILNTFDGFTYYTNATCAYPTTKGSLPFMLTGQYYLNEQPYNDYIKEAYRNTDIYERLYKANYEINLYTNDLFVPEDVKATYLGNGETNEIKINSYIGLEKAMLQFTAFRYFPHIAKQFVWFYSGIFDQYRTSVGGKEPCSEDNIAFYSGLKGNKLQTESGQNVYSFIHLAGTHPPFTLKEDVSTAEDGTATVVSQGIACLNIVCEYITQLKELGVYDNTMLIITADHGNAHEPGRWPIFLVKHFDESGAVKVSNAPISHENLLPTIMEECGLGDNNKYGKSIKEVLTSDVTERRYFFYNWDERWDKRYLPDIAECTVDVHKQFTITGIIYTSQGIEKSKPYEYQLGDTIVLTQAGGGNKYFTRGISLEEATHTWSFGRSGSMLVHVGEDTGDLTGEFQFKMVYAPPQRLVIRCGDLTLYDAEISSGEAPIRFTIPEGCIKEGMLMLDLEYPNAVSPTSRGESEDDRMLAFAFEKIRFYP